jgi:hypothetical protein
LVGHWRFDEGAGDKARDSSAKRRDGRIKNGAERVPGPVGTALKLDGKVGYVEVADAPGLRITGDLTIALWIRWTGDLRDYARLVGKGNQKHRTYGLWLRNQGVVLFQQYANGKDIVSLNGKAKIQKNKWYHLAAVVAGNEIRLSINGKLDSKKTRAGTPSTSADPLTIGYGTYHSYFLGVLDDVRIYNRALGAEEVTSLFRLGRPPQ